MQKTVAAFDFDGTITYKDILIPFFISTLGYKKTFFSVLKILPKLIKVFPKKYTRQLIKEAFLKEVINQIPVNTFEKWTLDYTEKKLKKQIKPSAFERYKWHKAQGHYCLIISANLDLLLAPWVKKVGFHALLASELEINKDHLLTGHLVGVNCWGDEKVKRLIKHLGPKKDYTLYAYGNSAGDKALLKLADYSFYKNFN